MMAVRHGHHDQGAVAPNNVLYLKQNCCAKILAVCTSSGVQRSWPSEWDITK